MSLAIWGCNERKTFNITNSSNSVVQQEEEKPIPATLFIPPEGSTVRIVIEEAGVQKELIGVIQTKADDFFVLEIQDGENDPYVLQIYYDEILDFEVIKLPKEYDDIDPDDGDNDDGDNDGKDCNYKWNREHWKWYRICRRFCKIKNPRVIKIILNRKRIGAILVILNRGILIY